MKAYSKSTTPKHLKDEQATPQAIFERIQDALHLLFAWDVCATAKNTKVKGAFWTKRNNALSQAWVTDNMDFTSDMVAFWMNPPYSMLPEFTAKAAEESQKQSIIVVGLVPHMPSSRWYQKFVHNVASAVYMPDGRINFELKGVVRPGNALPSCCPIWTPWRCTTSYNFFNRKG